MSQDQWRIANPIVIRSRYYITFWLFFSENGDTWKRLFTNHQYAILINRKVKLQQLIQLRPTNALQSMVGNLFLTCIFYIGLMMCTWLIVLNIVKKYVFGYWFNKRINVSTYLNLFLFNDTRKLCSLESSNSVLTLHSLTHANLFYF